MGYHVGIDTGGTFTDVVVLGDGGEVTSAKSPTTPDNLALGLMNGLESAAGTVSLALDDFLAATSVIRFSGTTATNALVTRRGAKTALVTSKGFEDTLTIGRALSAWAGQSELAMRRVYHQRKPELLVPRELIRGITERIDAHGRDVVALDVAELRTGVDELLEAGVESLAVCLLWSVRNPAHEIQAREIIAELAPDTPVHCSHEVAPSVGEYERFITTVVDAYVSPVLSRFLGRFQRSLADRGFTGQFLIAQADGGCLYPQDARPVSTLHSGPAAGVIASQHEGERLGYPNVVTTDVGGTSFDVGLVAEGSWIYAREPEVGRYHLTIPMIEVASIGAGGGSIAWVDEVGVLHVGPQSAGAKPGPACYGTGGTEPTVTDADLILGYLDPEQALGGRIALDRDLAEAAMQRVADELGLGVVEAAAGVFEIANAHMADLLRRQIVTRGYDPRDFAILAYGGAGPMHTAFYAANVGAREVIVPARAGTFSALGVATAPLLHSARRPVFHPMPMDHVELNGILGDLEATVAGALEGDGVPDDARDIRYVLEMRYGAQVHEIRLPIDRRQYDEASVEALSDRFDVAYEKHYGKGSGYGEAGRFLINVVVEGHGRLPVPERRAAEAGGGSVEAALLGTRRCYFDGEFVEANIYRYEALQPGHEVVAPAIIEASETTIVVPPGARAVVDPARNVRLSGLGATPAGLAPADVALTGGIR